MVVLAGTKNYYLNRSAKEAYRSYLLAYTPSPYVQFQAKKVEVFVL